MGIVSESDVRERLDTAVEAAFSGSGQCNCTTCLFLRTLHEADKKNGDAVLYAGEDAPHAPR